MKSRKRPEDLRSHRWLGVSDLRSFGHRSRLRQFGYDKADWEGKPVIGIINTWSDLNACHAHLRSRADDVKRGVWEAGGFPVELPAMSLSEPFIKPTTMLYRNFLAMETEELLRSHPIDGAVLMGGCDKTAPALLMGAISMGIPAILVPYPRVMDYHLPNAEVYAVAGAATVIDETELIGPLSEALVDHLEPLITDEARRSRMSASMRRLARPGAATNVANIIYEALFSNSVRLAA